MIAYGQLTVGSDRRSETRSRTGEVIIATTLSEIVQRPDMGAHDRRSSLPQPKHSHSRADGGRNSSSSSSDSDSSTEGPSGAELPGYMSSQLGQRPPAARANLCGVRISTSISKELRTLKHAHAMQGSLNRSLIHGVGTIIARDQ